MNREVRSRNWASTRDTCVVISADERVSTLLGISRLWSARRAEVGIALSYERYELAYCFHHAQRFNGRCSHARVHMFMHIDKLNHSLSIGSGLDADNGESSPKKGEIWVVCPGSYYIYLNNILS